MMKRIYVFFLILFIGCSNMVTLKMIDSESAQPIENLSVEFIDEDGNTKFMEDEITDQNGKIIFPASQIPGDSFFVSISNSDYFPKKETIYAADNAKTINVDKIATVIEGFVLDYSTYEPIEKCNISVSPPGLFDNETTDESGRFVLRSNEYSEVFIKIIANKSPDYLENSTELRPKENFYKRLQRPIYLKEFIAVETVIDTAGKEEVGHPPPVGGVAN